ncbi:MAG: hypothetical protein SGILL_005437 [Bacillariaceae sp.]
MSVSGKEQEKDLTDINENEAASDGVAPQGSSCGGSVGSGASSGSGGSKTKRRSWKKPKDKPKRPLSAYNIFFKHERSRIVEGKPEEATAEDVIRSIEIILSTSRETRRHRKTHGRISFGDLARRIADKWKGITPEKKSVFEHYADIDMRRYRKEVERWKQKKEAEALGKAGSGQEGSTTSNSFTSNSFSDSISEYSEPGVDPAHDPWGHRKNFYDSMSNSFSSVDSEVSFDRLPVQMQLQMMQQQQLRQQQMQVQMNNSGLNMHSSMPNLRRRSDGGMMTSFQPNMVQSGGTFGHSYDTDLSPGDVVGSNANIAMSNMNMMMAMQQQQGLQQGMNALHNSFSGRPSSFGMMQNGGMSDMPGPSVPFVIGGENGGNFQDVPPSLGFESPVTGNQKKPMADPAFSFHDVGAADPVSSGGVGFSGDGGRGVSFGGDGGLDPVPFNEVFPEDIPGGQGNDLGNYLSNLDLSTA